MPKKILFQEESEGEAERVEPEAVPYAKCRWDFFLSHWSTLCWIHFVKICGVWTVWTQIEPISQISQGHKQSNAQDAVQNLRLALSERFLGASFWLDIEQVRKTMFQTKDVALIFLDCTEMILPKTSKYIQMWRHRTLRRVFFFARIQPWGECATVCRIRAMSWSFWRRASPRANSVRWSYDGLWKPIGTWSSWWKRTIDMANPIWSTWSTGSDTSDTHFIQILRNLSNDMATNLGFPMFPLCIVHHRCPDDLKAVFTQNEIIPWFRDPEFRSVSVEKILRKCAQDPRRESSFRKAAKPLVQLVWNISILYFNGQQSLSQTQVCFSGVLNLFLLRVGTSPLHLKCGCLSPRYANKGGGDDGAEVFDKSFVIFTAMCGVALPGVPCQKSSIVCHEEMQRPWLHPFVFPCVSQQVQPGSHLQISSYWSPDDLCRQLNWVLCTPGSIFLFMLLH